MKFTTDMTTGKELGHIIRFTMPLLAGNLFQQLYNVVDSIIVGKYLGDDALAAVGSTGSTNFLFNTLCIGLGLGAGILISQRFGAGRENEVKKLIANSAYVLCGFGLLMSVLSVLFAPLMLRFLMVPEELFEMSLGYMRITCSGIIAVAAYNWINAVMRSLGDSKTPLMFLIVASILNAGLDLLFVIVLKMGVRGAALATITAQGISALSSISFAFMKNPFFKLSRENAAADKTLMIKVIKIGVPISLQNALIAVSMVYLQRTANSFGKTVMAAYTATMRVEQVIQQPFSSLSAAVSTFTGQNIGAGKTDRVVKGYKESVKAVCIFSLVMMTLFMLTSKIIVGIFLNEQPVIKIGGTALKYSSCFYVFLGLIYVTRGLLNGAGDVGYSMINGIAEVVGRIGFATLLVHIHAAGLIAVWGTTCLTWMLTAIMSLIRYKQGTWKLKSDMLTVKKEEAST